MALGTFTCATAPRFQDESKHRFMDTYDSFDPTFKRTPEAEARLAEIRETLARGRRKGGFYSPPLAENTATTAPGNSPSNPAQVSRVPAIPTAPSVYSIPGTIPLGAAEASDDEALMQRLRNLCDAEESYLDIRDDFLAVNMALNRHGAMIPWGRHLPSSPPFSKDPLDHLASNDRQFIDLHWIACRAHAIRVTDRRFRQLISGTYLDWDIAAEFIRLVGRTQTKVTVLGINDLVQCELCVLHNDEIRQRKMNAKKLRPKVSAALSNLAAKNLKMKADSDWDAVIEADIILPASEFPAARSDEFCNLLRWPRRPLAGSNIRKKRIAMEKHLAANFRSWRA